jgi:hypothetical protein
MWVQRGRTSWLDISVCTIVAMTMILRCECNICVAGGCEKPGGWSGPLLSLVPVIKSKGVSGGTRLANILGYCTTN